MDRNNFVLVLVTTTPALLTALAALLAELRRWKPTRALEKNDSRGSPKV